MIERAPSLEVGQRVRLIITTEPGGWSAAAERALNGRVGTVGEVRVPEQGTGLALLGVGYLVRLDEAVPAEAIGTTRELAELWLARRVVAVPGRHAPGARVHGQRAWLVCVAPHPRDGDRHVA